MAAPPDLNAILAALAAGRGPRPHHLRHRNSIRHNTSPRLQACLRASGRNATATPPQIPGFNFPQPTTSGSLDLSAIKPVNSGSVSIQDALAKARGFAAQKGLAFEARQVWRTSGLQQYGGPDRSTPPNDNSEVILIDSSLVGLVIGRQGESLRRIEQESGTRIQFINGPEAGPQRQCRITGPPGARISAKREINRIIEENGGNPARETGRNARAPQKATSQQPALREGEQSSQIMVPDRTVGLIIERERSSPVNLIGSPAAAAHAKELIMEIVDNIMVPSDAVGMIIAKKGGETIKQMQSDTGCKINVSQASAIDDAKQAIWDKVDQREKNNSRRRDNGGQDNNYSQQQQPQQPYGQAAPQGQPHAPAAGAPAGGAADPYAIYGGYQNYLAMWYASFAQQQQQGGAPPGPPGA
ncbi:hypothetical protein EJ07DRAFT_170082 [Lizonia empirigonia]|nr:hypothetical protein EJ07DRAFT_170082 [Lizonia empirigonia]